MIEYPLSEHVPDRLRTASGKRFDQVTLAAVVAGEITMEDLRVSSESLCWQAEIARNNGRPQLADNLMRAAELVVIPEERILEIYDALRPARANREKLLQLADDIEREYGAVRCAALIREAAPPKSELEERSRQPILCRLKGEHH